MIFDNRFGNKEAGKSIIKSVLALVHYKGVSTSYCQLALGYLFRDEEPCFGYYYESDLIKNRVSGVPINCVAVKGSASKRRIIAYVEYYGVQRIVCCVSNNYVGEDFSATYAFDPVSGNELKLEVDLELSDEKIKNIYNYECITPEILENAYGTVIHEAYKRRLFDECDSVISDTIDAWCKINDQDEESGLTEQQMWSLSSMIADNLLPMFMNKTSNRNQ